MSGSVGVGEARSDEDARVLFDLAVLLTEPSLTGQVLAEATRRVCQWTGWVGSEVWVLVNGSLERAAAWFAEESQAKAIAATGETIEFHRRVGVLGRAVLPASGLPYPPELVDARARIVESAGLRLAHAEPLEGGGAVEGVVTFYALAGDPDVSVPDMFPRAIALLSRGLSRVVLDTNQAVTQRRLAMQAQVLMHIAEGVSLSDERGNVIYVNEAMGRLVDRAPAEMIDKPVTAFCDEAPEACMARYHSMWDALARSKEWHGELPRQRGDGSTMLTAVHVTSLMLDGVPYALAVHSEVNDLNGKQIELETARHRLEHLLTANPAIIYTRSSQDPRVITFISDDVRGRFRYEPSQFLDGSDFWLEHIHPEDAGRILMEVSEAVGLEFGSFEYRFLHGDGRYRWVHDEYKIVPGKAGSAELIGCWVDISEIKETEFMLERQTRRLAKSNRELEQFAYVASHDLRAPLRAIDTLSEWLEQDLSSVLTADSKQQMSLLRGRVRRMDRLLADLLEYSRIGRVNVPTDAVDTAELVAEVVDLSQLDQNLEIRLEKPMPAFVTARLPLKRVFMNLLTNAVKHHDRPRGIVTVRCIDRGDYFEFSVTDDGPGIPEEYHDRVFQMFQTLKPRDANEGSGMGLALVRRVVESAGGRLALESGNGRGSTFRFTWPRVWRDVPPASSSMPVLAAPDPALIGTKRRKREDGR